MQIPKVQKIDQQQTYPCPCRRKASLKPITLTDAFGCDRCSLIFVVEDSGYSLVQLGGIDPYRRVWHWIGSRWQLSRNLGAKYPLELPTQLLLVSTALLMLLLLLALKMGLPERLSLAIIVFAPLILVIWWWLVVRHRDP